MSSFITIMTNVFMSNVFMTNVVMTNTVAPLKRPGVSPIYKIDYEIRTHTSGLLN